MLLLSILLEITAASAESPNAISSSLASHSTNGISANLPIDFLRESLMNYASFDEILQMRLVNREFYNMLTPYFQIKDQCRLKNEDVWPPQMLKLHDIDKVQGPNCLNILKQHSNLYEEVLITVPMIDPSLAIRFINAVNPKKSLTINFPDYHDYVFDQIISTQTQHSINSGQLKTILQFVEENDRRSIKIKMT